MTLESLFTLHIPKDGRDSFVLPQAEGMLVLETCLRHIGVARHLPAQFVPGTQVFQGVHAYRFLLEVACGLHSKMQGESEIFGQVKEAWRQFGELRSAEAKPLARTMQHLFADTKRIRTDYLHGLGGQSYPGAVQRLLELTKGDRVLVIGAGQFGQMLAAKMLSRAGGAAIINRSALPLQLLKSKYPALDILPGFDALEEGIRAATHVLVCMPEGADMALDSRIRAAWAKKKKGKLIHFGQMDFTGSPWEKTPRFFGLSDVMDVQNHRSKAKPHAVERAFEAARRLADERVHGVSLKSRLMNVA